MTAPFAAGAATHGPAGAGTELARAAWIAETDLWE